uniref:Uncharacterized protein n=1 Tax=Arundo donax TaxID=35708 RepID=A0A0A9BJA3_ARUDO
MVVLTEASVSYSVEVVGNNVDIEW